MSDRRRHGSGVEMTVANEPIKFESVVPKIRSVPHDLAIFAARDGLRKTDASYIYIYIYIDIYIIYIYIHT